MREFEIRYFNEINFVTDWMTDTQEGLDLLREKTKIIAQDLLKFLSAKDKLIEGIHIHYYYLNSDSLGEDGNVVNWSVTLTPKYECGYSEDISGCPPETLYQIIEED